MMEYTTLILAHKRGEIQIEGAVHYDIYSKVSDISKTTKEFIVVKGKKTFDFIGLCDPWNMAISENVKKLLEDNLITGWKAYPIEVKGVDLQYYLFDVVVKSEMKCKYDINGYKEYGSIEIDEQTIDNSDFFCVGDTAIIACTEKVKTLFESNKITNVEFIGLENY